MKYLLLMSIVLYGFHNSLVSIKEFLTQWLWSLWFVPKQSHCPGWRFLLLEYQSHLVPFQTNENLVTAINLSWHGEGRTLNQTLTYRHSFAT